MLLSAINKLKKRYFFLKHLKSLFFASNAFLHFSALMTNSPLDFSVWLKLIFDVLFKIETQSPYSFTPNQDPPAFLSFPANIKGYSFQWKPGVWKALLKYSSLFVAIKSGHLLFFFS